MKPSNKMEIGSFTSKLPFAFSKGAASMDFAPLKTFCFCNDHSDMPVHNKSHSIPLSMNTAVGSNQAVAIAQIIPR